jgi:hypothetical protein
MGVMPDYPSLQIVAGTTSVSASNGMAILTGNGNPNGSVSGNAGQLYVDTSASTNPTIYTNKNGTNTGWV